MTLPAHNTHPLSGTAIELLTAGHCVKVQHYDLDNPHSVGDEIDLGRFVVRVEIIADKCYYGKPSQELTVRAVNHA